MRQPVESSKEQLTLRQVIEADRIIGADREILDLMIRSTSTPPSVDVDTLVKQLGLSRNPLQVALFLRGVGVGILLARKAGKEGRKRRKL